MRTLDLFCGCGGLTAGLSMASYRGRSFQHVAGLDFHQPSIATFAANHPGAIPFCVDIRKANIDAIYDKIGKIDIIVGGPSCQGFSTHGKRIADDPRNFLYRCFIQFVEYLKPSWVLLENVTGLLRYGNGEFRDRILDDFRRLGYVISFAQLQAAQYGVPQIRKRLIFIANRRDIPFFFPRPTHAESPDLLGELKPYVTVADAIGDLPRIGLGCSKENAPRQYLCDPMSDYQHSARRDSRSLRLHYGTPVPSDNYARIVSIPPGGDWLDIPSDLLPPRFSRVLPKDATTLYYRLRWDKPGYTITTVYRNVSSGAFTHPEEDRALTHREAARIQSFPDTYKFCEPSIPSQIGNAVPPLLARILGQAILFHDELYRPIRSLRALNEFQAEVRNAEEAFFQFGDIIKPPELPTLEGHQGLGLISDAAWGRVEQMLKPLSIHTYSQLSYRAVLNVLLRPDFYEADVSAKISAIRTVETWKSQGLLEPLLRDVNRILADIKTPSDVTATGHERKKARRKRLRPSSTHHFATILYPLDPNTRCTSPDVSSSTHV